MDNVHTIDILPKQESINALAAFSVEFNDKEFDLTAVLTNLKDIILETKFMDAQDNSFWMERYGCDFIGNPSLFSLAPLTYTCVFLGELFNNFEVDEIKERASAQAIEQALLRLNAFKTD